MDRSSPGSGAIFSLVGLAINLGLVFAGTHVLAWPLRKALIPVVLIVPASTFVMSKFWAFRVAEAAGEAAQPPPSKTRARAWTAASRPGPSACAAWPRDVFRAILFAARRPYV